MKSTAPFLSKSKYLSGLQCSKLLWYNYNAKEEIPAPDAAQQAIFDQGNLVGNYAKRLFPGGIEITAEHFEIEKTIEESVKALALRKPLFEAGFRHKDAYSRADVLNPVGKDEWDLIEVKSSTQVKDVNLHDVALQRYVYEGAGLKIRKCRLCYINNAYVRKGDVEVQKLFTLEDVTEDVARLLPGIEKNLRHMVTVIQLATCPDIRIGPHCSDPYECPLREKCWSFLPKHSVFTLTRLGAKAFDLLEEGIEEITAIPDGYSLAEKQQIQRAAIRTGKPHINREGISSFLRTLEYPLFFLDFETFMTAIPRYDNVRPYQSIPFQYSLHIVRTPGGEPKHHSYLSDGKTDPRPELLQGLKKLLERKGSIVCYNAGFERGKLADAATAFTEYAEWFHEIEGRIVDLLAPFRSFYYYHPDQTGSASIKKVLPCLVGKGYDEMEIADGGAASNEYLRVTFGDAAEAERENIRSQLEKYCSQDTMAMVWIVERLIQMQS